jgi:Hypervirulence associated proteins TUDOR domain
MATYKVGDQVKWNSHAGQAHGKVVRVAHESGEVSGFHYQASHDDPRYIVEVESGKLTAHTADALSKT